VSRDKRADDLPEGSSEAHELFDGLNQRGVFEARGLLKCRKVIVFNVSYVIPGS